MINMIDLTFNMSNGDMDFITDDDNMIGACIRRLDTALDSTLYEVYGSNLRSLLGLRKSDVNLQFLEHSINDCLSQDTRLDEITVSCVYSSNGIVADISIVYEDNVLEFNYETSSDEEVMSYA
jgi:hypothetical protein